LTTGLNSEEPHTPDLETKIEFLHGFLLKQAKNIILKQLISMVEVVIISLPVLKLNKKLLIQATQETLRKFKRLDSILKTKEKCTG
jgi:hypothetical protein